MFKVKICGITTPEDALLAADLGADAIGLNFYKKTPRHVTVERANQIIRGIREADANERAYSLLEIIGVFVDSSELSPEAQREVNDTMFRLCQSNGARNFTAFQMHGDEPEKLTSLISPPSPRLDKEMAKALRTPDPAFPVIPCIRAFRCRSPNLNAVGEYLLACKCQDDQIQQLLGLENPPTASVHYAILLDAHAPGFYGGTGNKLDWNMIREQRDNLLGVPLILAGGLTADNVAEAIATARPDAVDVASGVESSPGKKDPSKVRDFVAAAKEAFAGLERENPG